MKSILSKIINPDEKYLWLLFVLFSALYFLTYIQGNMVLRSYAGHDDALYFTMGQNISAGNWLGEYHSLTLAKAPSYAIFIALSILSGIPYLWMIAACNIFAVSFLLRKSRYLFDKMKLLSLLAGVLLLFNPIFAQTLRVYRFQLPAICFLVFIGSLITIFNPAEKKSHRSSEVIDAVTVFVAWGFLWFSREESLFYFGCLVVALTAFFAVKKVSSYPIGNLTPVLYGLSGVLIFWIFISGMNNKYYSRPVVCEKTSSPYTDVIKTFHSIADPDFPQNISGSAASLEKILTIAEVVPFFKPMAGHLINSTKLWRGTYFDRQTLEFVGIPRTMLTVSHFEWAWITAAKTGGYYKDASTLAEFYTQLDKELEKAIREGRLLTRKDTLVQAGPYFLLKRDLATIIRLIPKYYFFVFPKPNEIALWYQNLLVQISSNSIGNEGSRKAWGEHLNVHYIAEGDVQRYDECLNSFANRFWNKATEIYAYTAVPLMHLATPIAFITLILLLIRRKWVPAAVITVLSSMYIAHYLMLIGVTVASGYYAAHVRYFLPSYHAVILNSFVSIGALLSLLSRHENIKPESCS